MLQFGQACFGQSSPTGNDSQGGVAVPPGQYQGIPSSGPVPVNAYTSNSFREVDELQVASASEIPLAWNRYSETRSIAGSTPLASGGCWRHSYQWDFATTTVNGTPALQVIYPNGTTNYFTQTSPNVWTSTSAVTDIITPSGSSYNLTNSANQVYNFTLVSGSTYHLGTITDSKGQVTTLTYSTYGLSKVSEPGGRYLTLNYIQCTVMSITNGPPHGGGGNGITQGQMAQPQTSGTTYTYAYYISKVTSSDSRSVSYTYPYQYFVTTTSSQTVLYYHYYLSQAKYTDNSTGQYTYDGSAWQSYAGGIMYLTGANDVRAKGVPNVSYSFYGGTNPSGAVSTVKEATSGNTISTVSLKGSNTQTPAVTYPDGSVYNYTVNPGGLQASVANTLLASRTYAYKLRNGKLDDHQHRLERQFCRPNEIDQWQAPFPNLAQGGLRDCGSDRNLDLYVHAL